MNITCIHQPDFAPYLGFFHRLLSTKQFIILDDVQFIRRGWQHRDYIKGQNGSVWLTLSLQKGDYHQTISEVSLSKDSKWIEANLNLIKSSYSKSKYFSEIYPKIEAIYHAGHIRMMDFNLAIINLALDYFEIKVNMSYASEYAITTSSSQRLVDLVSAVGGDVYLTGIGSKDYLDEALFSRAGISVMWQEFKHPTYSQLYGEFEPMLSCLDILFNCGRESASILRS